MEPPGDPPRKPSKIGSVKLKNPFKGFLSRRTTPASSRSATPTPKQQGVAEPHSRTGFEAIKLMLQTVVNVTDVFTPVKSAAAGILAFLNTIEVSAPSKHTVESHFNKLQGVC
jgi:hypothetical protein